MIDRCRMVGLLRDYVNYQHAGAEVDSNDAARWPNPLGGNEAVETGTATQVKDCQSLTKLCLKGNAPARFVASLRRVTATGQDAACSLAGGGDGGGMEPNNFQQVQRTLNRIGDDIALRCLRHVEKSYHDAAENNKEAR
jgi:hypothetical protein